MEVGAILNDILLVKRVKNIINICAKCWIIYTYYKKVEKRVSKTGTIPRWITSNVDKFYVKPKMGFWVRREVWK